MNPLEVSFCMSKKFCHFARLLYLCNAKEAPHMASCHANQPHNQLIFKAHHIIHDVTLGSHHRISKQL